MLSRSMLARAVVPVLLAISSSAAAAPASLVPTTSGAFTLRGKGMRGAATIGGTLVRAADGSVSGDFVVLLTPANDSATSCRYQKFTKVERSGGRISFEGIGSCTSVAASGAVTAWKAHNRFAFVLAAGKGKDDIDVNMVGATGITVAGGPLDGGDFQLR